jgi:hypothetical protein
MNRSCLHTRHERWTFALVLVLAGCASGAGAAGAGGTAELITQEQIDEAALDSALEVIRRFRPRWLQATRNPTSGGVAPVGGRPGMPQDGRDTIGNEVYPTVVRDGIRLGEIDTLASISSRTVASIRFLSPTDARTRYGSGFDGGVIEVVSR